MEKVSKHLLRGMEFRSGRHFIYANQRLSNLQVSNIGPRLQTVGPAGKKVNVLLAFREAILGRFSNNAFLPVLAAVNRPLLAQAIGQGKEYRSS